jgi:hypothetical protein
MHQHWGKDPMITCPIPDAIVDAYHVPRTIEQLETAERVVDDIDGLRPQAQTRHAQPSLTA